MADFIAVADLPTALQSADMVNDMVAGANAKASRVAPCLIAPTTAWDASTAYALDDTVKLTGGEALKVTTAGTSGTLEPTAPANLGDTVTDGTVTWARIAPTPDQLAEARLILFGAVKRWIEAGSGAYQTQTAGPFGIGIDTRQKSSGYNLWPSEITALQDICATATTGSSGAFSIIPGGTSVHHMLWCSINFGANYCSCGADLTNYEYPLYEGGVLSGDEY
jgi:hypothetical protein